MLIWVNTLLENLKTTRRNSHATTSCKDKKKYIVFDHRSIYFSTRKPSDLAMEIGTYLFRIALLVIVSTTSCWPWRWLSKHGVEMLGKGPSRDYSHANDHIRQTTLFLTKWYQSCLINVVVFNFVSVWLVKMGFFRDLFLMIFSLSLLFLQIKPERSTRWEETGSAEYANIIISIFLWLKAPLSA